MTQFENVLGEMTQVNIIVISNHDLKQNHFSESQL